MDEVSAKIQMASADNMSTNRKNWDQANGNRKPAVYVLSSGGTGGHLFPALSLAQEIEQEGQICHLVTDNRGLAFFREYEKKPSLVCMIHRKHWLFGKLVYPFSLAFQILRCLLWLRRIRPSAVVGFGGYPSFPCVFAAQLLGITTFLHEGNAFLGKANRQLLKKAKRVALSFPPSVEDGQDFRLNQEKYRVTGMPARPEVCLLQNSPYNAPKAEDPFHLLIMGGSQGAKIFGSLVPKAIALLPKDLQRRLVVTQQCREQQIKETKLFYKGILCKKTIKSFLSPIDHYYAEAHLVIARSGASTVAEVAIAGKPTLFVPFQGSVEGDQARNAAQLVEADAAWLIRESSLTPVRLAEFLAQQMTSPEGLVQKSKTIRSFSHPEAAKALWGMIQA